MTDTTLKITLTPVDVLFCRDGRPYGAGYTAVSTLPSPQVLSGAIRSAWLRENDALPRAGESINDDCFDMLNSIRIRGPLLQKDGELMLPVPADLAWDRKKTSTKDSTMDEQQKIVRLRPLMESAWQLSDGRHPLWGPAKSTVNTRCDWQAITGCMMKFSALKKYLEGENISRDDLVENSELYTLETRTHVDIDTKTHTAEEGKLFVQKVLRLQENVCLYAEITYDTATWEKGIGNSLNLGGDRHQCIVASCENPPSWPASKNDTDSQHQLIYHLSPCLYPAPHSHAPEWGNKLCSAALPGHLAVSGWDYRKNQPKPTRHAIVAGSVHLLNESTGNEANGSIDGQCAGFGWTLIGTWQPWAAA